MPYGYYMGTVPGLALEPSQKKLIWTLTAIFCKARNTLELENLRQWLDDDVVYESQGVRHPLEDKENVMNYLEERWEFIRGLDRDTGYLYPGEVGLTKAREHPCGIFEEVGVRTGLYVIDASDAGLIKRVDILFVAPRPEEAKKIAEEWPHNPSDLLR